MDIPLLFEYGIGSSIGVVRWCVASTGDLDRGTIGVPPLLGAGGGRDDSDGESKSGVSFGPSPIAAATADNRDLRKSLADVLLLGEKERRGELPGTPGPPPDARCSFLVCKTFKASFNSFAPPVKLATCSLLRKG